MLFLTYLNYLLIEDLPKIATRWIGHKWSSVSFCKRTQTLPFSLSPLSLVPWLISAMASKLLSHSHLRVIYSSNTRICSNPTRATRALLNLRPFSDSSSPPPLQSHNNTINDTGMGRASTPSLSSLKELELAKFASIAETWSAFKLTNLFLISFAC